MGRPKARELTFFQTLALEAVATDRPLGDDDDARRTTCPLLWEWLTTVQLPDDYVKEPPRLVIQAVPGGFLASISDASLARTVDVAIRTLDEACDALERGLREGTATVRCWGKVAPKMRKKTKGS